MKLIKQNSRLNVQDLAFKDVKWKENISAELSFDEHEPETIMWME